MALAERRRGAARGDTAPQRAKEQEDFPQHHDALDIDRPLLIGRDMAPGAVQFRNFDSPEDDFVWSTGRFAEIVFAAEPAAEPTVLVLELDVFRAPPVLPGQHVLAYVNGLRLLSAFVGARSTLEIPLRPDTLADGPNTLTFDLPDATRPMDYGMEDSRMLGVKLFSLALEPAA